MGQHYWMMSPAEQAALVFLLEHLRPKVAIEIGTRFGGSLQVLGQFCDRVYSLDINPEVPQRLDGRFPNVEYLVGPSAQTLPPLIDRLQREGAELSFTLVDGDHSAEEVRKDIDNLLQFRPTVPFYIITHGSLLPSCREGLKQAKWSASPYVHAVELDFVAGSDGLSISATITAEACRRQGETGAVGSVIDLPPSVVPGTGWAPWRISWTGSRPSWLCRHAREGPSLRVPVLTDLPFSLA